MATIHTTFHLSINRIFPPQIPLNHHKTAPRCELSSHNLKPMKQSRRILPISLILLHSLSSLPPHAIAGSIFDRYVKRLMYLILTGSCKPVIVFYRGFYRPCYSLCCEYIYTGIDLYHHLIVYVIRKKLEPLETYVPAVLLTQLQIKDIEESLEVDQPQYASYRSFLRSGPAASFRSNVAEYASDGGNVKTAFDDVERCLRALDELDSLLLRASRNSSDASAKLMKEKISTAMNALNSLLETVPTDVLDKAKAIAEAYRSPESSEVPEELDQELKELQSIL